MPVYPGAHKSRFHSLTPLEAIRESGIGSARETRHQLVTKTARSYGISGQAQHGKTKQAKGLIVLMIEFLMVDLKT